MLTSIYFQDRLIVLGIGAMETSPIERCAQPKKDAP
jgi:hypothetical protein